MANNGLLAWHEVTTSTPLGHLREFEASLERIFFWRPFEAVWSLRAISTWWTYIFACIQSQCSLSKYSRLLYLEHTSSTYPILETGFHETSRIHFELSTWPKLS